MRYTNRHFTYFTYLLEHQHYVFSLSVPLSWCTSRANIGSPEEQAALAKMAVGQHFVLCPCMRANHSYANM